MSRDEPGLDATLPDPRGRGPAGDGARIDPGVVLRDRYEVRGLIGRGGMGLVYEAWDRVVGREVALKRVRPGGVAPSAGELARLRDELVAIQEVVHPGIVRVYTLEEAGDERFLVMERLRGGTLAERLRGGASEVGEAVAIARALLDALAAAHARGIVHRDVKPGNVFLADDGRVVLLDFGLARAGAAGPGATPGATIDGSMVCGTPGYIAPEVIAGGRAGPSADVYAVGVVLWEMLAGRHPIEGAGLDLLARQLERPTPAAPPGAPRWLARALAAMLDADPARRPAAAVALAPPPPSRWRGRATTIALAVAAGALAGVTTSSRPAPAPASEAADAGAAVDGEAARLAEQAFSDGVAHYEAGRYAAAIDAWEEAYTWAPSSQMVYNLARAHHRHGDPARALVLYRRYLEGAAHGATRDQVDRAIRELEAADAARSP